MEDVFPYRSKGEERGSVTETEEFQAQRKAMDAHAGTRELLDGCPNIHRITL